jgi:hypothetical protein
MSCNLLILGLLDENLTIVQSTSMTNSCRSVLIHPPDNSLSKEKGDLTGRLRLTDRYRE